MIYLWAAWPTPASSWKFPFYFAQENYREPAWGLQVQEGPWEETDWNHLQASLLWSVICLDPSCFV